MQRFKISKEGYAKLKEELDDLINVQRPAISKAIGEAIELGDLSENAEYSSAKERQGIVESMIATLSEKIAGADVVDLGSLKGDAVDFGATVTILDQDTDRKLKYKLLSEFESDLDNGIISMESLVGKALKGKIVGDEVEINTPSGIKSYEVLEIKFN